MNKTRRLSRVLILLLPVILSIIGSAFAQTNSPVLEVPFNFDNNEIVVLAMINNEGPYRMLLDTGSTVSYVDRGLAKKLALKQGKKGNTAVGYDTREKVYPTKLSSVRLGPLEASDVEAFVYDMTVDQAEGFEK